MSNVFDFFKRRKNRDKAVRSYDDILDDLKQHAAPALTLRKTDDITSSYLGGLPHLPPGAAWPTNEQKPLSLLASLDLQAIAATGTIPWLPPQGTLLFFYDADAQPWGFDPKDRAGWSVLFIDAASPVEPAEGPALPKLHITFETIGSIPDPQRFDALGIQLDEDELEVFSDEHYERIGDSADLQMGGYPTVIQNDDMELESQLASNGIYCGDVTGYASAAVQRLAPGAKDWRLLLQLSSDEDLDVMWGDVGNLYFWVREQDARAGNFGNVWVVLQCF